MTAWSAYREGARRVARAPVVVFGVWLTSVVMALPLALVLREMIAAHLGDSLAAAAALRGVNWDWWQEFSAQATGIGTTFTPSILGFAAVLRNVSDLLDNRSLATVIAGALTAWLVVWSFLSGGVLDRLARNRTVGASGFFAAAGTHVFRFVRLGVVAWLLYYLLFAYVHEWLFTDLWRAATRDLTVERTAAQLRLGLYAVFVLLLAAVNLVLDYARIRIVVEDRRSALGAIAAGWRFVARRPGRTAGLYLLNSLGFVVLVAVYGFVAPAARHAGAAEWAALLLGQAYIVGRLWVKLLFYASQVALFQGELAHAEYVAAPAPEWPESPAAESAGGGGA
jgi:hypothetical protein